MVVVSSGSSIEWTEATWNPVVGCTRASAGCDHCYAVKQTYRLEWMGQAKYAGLTVLNSRGDRHFNGVVRTVPEALEIPLRWRKPRMIFVNSMSDLFHKDVPFEFIDQVFAVMALCPQHTFQVLTKRPERMAEYLTFVNTIDCINQQITILGRECDSPEQTAMIGGAENSRQWPLPNVWLLASCEDQEQLDKRVPDLLRCPAAVRGLSLEPLLGPMDLLRVDASGFGGPSGHKIDCVRKGYWSGGPFGFVNHSDMHDRFGPLHWVIIGGESGPGARPCNIDWIRSLIAQCKAAAVPCFTKQLGSSPFDSSVPIVTNRVRGGRLIALTTNTIKLKDRKGGDIDEFPADLRVREFPDNPRSVTGGYVSKT